MLGLVNTLQLQTNEPISRFTCLTSYVEIDRIITGSPGDLSLKKEAKLEGTCIGLADLIAYQEGAVVSRTIIDKKAGTVTLFAFDEGQGLSEHTAPYDALIEVLEGEARVTISGKIIVVKQGEVTIMPANRPHAISALTQFKMLLTMIRS
jgi:quercetin dioxygenase-like cupin family protein